MSRRNMSMKSKEVHCLREDLSSFANFFGVDQVSRVSH